MHLLCTVLVYWILCLDVCLLCRCASVRTPCIFHTFSIELCFDVFPPICLLFFIFPSLHNSWLIRAPASWTRIERRANRQKQEESKKRKRDQQVCSQLVTFFYSVKETHNIHMATILIFLFRLSPFPTNLQSRLDTKLICIFCGAFLAGVKTSVRGDSRPSNSKKKATSNDDILHATSNDVIPLSCLLAVALSLGDRPARGSSTLCSLILQSRNCKGSSPSRCCFHENCVLPSAVSVNATFSLFFPFIFLFYPSVVMFTAVRHIIALFYIAILPPSATHCQNCQRSSFPDCVVAEI